MKTILTILLCLPIIGFAQEPNIKLLDCQNSLSDKSIIYKQKRSYLELTKQEKRSLKDSLINISSMQMAIDIPYPIIFIHGLNGDFSSWADMGMELSSKSYNFGGYLNFCLNADYNNSTANISNDVASLMPTVIPVGDFYIIDFDCSISLPCNTNTSSIILSNQSAIVKQGYALGLVIDKVLNATGKDKVILMGHSMGGLAAREYIQNTSNWLDPTHHRVAKLITSATPHGGSNASGWGPLSTLLSIALPVPDDQSEAVRDLRRDYPSITSSNPPGAYLYGGYESNNTIFTNIFSFQYYNVDVNCNGSLGNTIVGLNYKLYYTDIDYSIIYSDYTTSSSPNSSYGDGLVGTHQANLSNYNVSIDYELFKSNDYNNNGFSDFYHLNITEDKQANWDALDEPDEFNLAYGIDLNTYYRGSITHQGIPGYNNDYDDFIFTVSQAGYLSGKVDYILPNSELRLYDVSNASYLINAVVGSSGSVTLSNVLVTPGNYIIEIKSTPSILIDFYQFKAVFNPVTPSWNCISPGNCQDPGTGQGAYTTQAACQSSCVLPTWNCVDDVCVDPGTGNGQYTTQSACQSACVSTSITEIDLESISIYPNPTDGIFTIEFTTKTAIDVSFSVLNVLGQEIALNKIKATVGVNKQQFDLSGFAKGVYALKLISENGVMDKKVVLE
tara:strand:+ start:4810 stop:6822 length:2013 start_codon:yes stop_codon:yes gene_type:complete